MNSASTMAVAAAASSGDSQAGRRDASGSVACTMAIRSDAGAV